MQVLTFELFCVFFVDFLNFFVFFFVFFLEIFYFDLFGSMPFFNFQDNSMQRSRKQQNVNEFM